VARFWDGKQWTEATLPPQYTPPELVVPRPEVTSAPTGRPQVYVPANNPGVAVLLSFFLRCWQPLRGLDSCRCGAADLLVRVLAFMLAAIPAFLIVWIVGMATEYGAAVKFQPAPESTSTALAAQIHHLVLEMPRRLPVVRADALA
jgi:hypothetical protein